MIYLLRVTYDPSYNPWTMHTPKQYLLSFSLSSKIINDAIDVIDNQDAGSEEDVAAHQTELAPQTDKTEEPAAPTPRTVVSIKDAIGRKYGGVVRRRKLVPKAQVTETDKVNNNHFGGHP